MTARKSTKTSTAPETPLAGAPSLPAKTTPKAKPAKTPKTVQAPVAPKSKSPRPKAEKAPTKAPKAAKTKAAQAVTSKTKVAETPKEGTAKVLDSTVEYEGPLFRVVRDHIVEPNGQESHRDVIRHNGSVVILAADPGKKKKDPWIVIERQYRHAAGQYLWELPAGKLDAGESPLEGAKRELSEETGYKAKKWSPLVNYFASPGFLGESMNVFLAEGLVAGDAHPEEDEHIDFRLVKLSELLDLIDEGKIIDGKTLSSVLLYARQLGVKRKH